MLTLLPTPIGNLGDITLRALETLRNADLLAAEDTRHTARLLRHFELHVPMLAYHEHNESRRTPELLAALREGKHLVLVSDAGMPLISDPGFRLLEACRAESLPFTVLPGPSAVITAVAGAGFGGNAFRFAGFLPVKSGGRIKSLEQARDTEDTTVFFESPHRLVKTLEAADPLLGSRPVCVARELTKQFEEYRHGTAGELAAHYRTHPPKGEICLVIAGRSRKDPLLQE